MFNLHILLLVVFCFWHEVKQKKPKSIPLGLLYAFICWEEVLSNLFCPVLMFNSVFYFQKCSDLDDKLYAHHKNERDLNSTIKLL